MFCGSSLQKRVRAYRFIMHLVDNLDCGGRLLGLAENEDVGLGEGLDAAILVLNVNNLLVQVDQHTGHAGHNLTNIG